MTENHASNNDGRKSGKPEILAPAGNKAAFLAALAADADAIYCGLKQFSARMAAENFTIPELAQLTRLAHDRKKLVYVAVNTLIKPDELDDAGRLIDQLNRQVHPDGLIIQDLAFLSLARQTNFRGELHLSTIANVSFPAALDIIREMPDIKRVVLPRELTVDEIKSMAGKCPDNLSLEVFVHGALCYAVSGRCYWSSYLGGKSGLRGRCVQPCRRIYAQDKNQQKFFSCRDLWLDILTKLLVEVPQVSALKIEGRKKGPHYVYYTTAAYRLIRDYPNDRDAKKAAAEYLDYALGRPGTHFYFLPQRPFSPIDVGDHTGSGLLVGKIQGPSKKPYLEPRMALFNNDVLRIGYEDEPWHRIYRVRKNVPKKGNLYLNFSEKDRPRNGTAVFLIDRREGDLDKAMGDLEKELNQLPMPEPKESRFRADRPQRAIKQSQPFEMIVYRDLPEEMPDQQSHIGVWLTNGESEAAIKEDFRVWYWLPPVIWPDEEAAFASLIDRALKQRCRNFVLNAPWQIMLFPNNPNLRLWAGPFCNAANDLAVEMLEFMGFSGVIVSPELGKADFTKLPAKSPLPLGIVIWGNWPLCISRNISEAIDTEKPFASPKGEQSWIRKYGQNYWVYPNWPINLISVEDQLTNIGYRLFIHMAEPIPEFVQIKKRQGFWNWDIGLK